MNDPVGGMTFLRSPGMGARSPIIQLLNIAMRLDQMNLWR
jgi:hypothetical protein